MSVFGQVTRGYCSEDPWRQLWEHERAAISEGICPAHQIPLEAVAVPPHRIAGHCTLCGKFWGLNLDGGEAGWWLDHDPRHPERSSCAVPDWMEWRPET